MSGLFRGLASVVLAIILTVVMIVVVIPCMIIAPFLGVPWQNLFNWLVFEGAKGIHGRRPFKLFLEQERGRMRW